MNLKLIKAFTLSEVLIALVIIGVIAALTVSSLLQSAHKKELETAFEKSYSTLSRAFNLVISEGYDVYVLNPTESRPDGDVDFNSEFAQRVYSKYNNLKALSSADKTKYRNTARNFKKKKLISYPQCSQFFNSTNSFSVLDGSTIGIAQNCGALWFTIDTNGISKGPNALGHDIFIFTAPKDSTKLIPAYSESELKENEDGSYSYNNTQETKDKCSFSSSSDINGATCSAFALANKCPDGSGRTYWECLR